MGLLRIFISGTGMSCFFIFGIKIFRLADTGDNRFYIFIGYTIDAVFQAIPKKLGYAVFDIVYDFVSTLFMRKITFQAFYVLSQYFKGCFLNGYHLTLKINADHFFHCCGSIYC